jgi:hypothetical protein
MEDKHNRQKQLAVKIADSADAKERKILLDWALGLEEIRNKSLPARKKAVEAIKLTGRSKIVIKVAKLIAREIKRHSWDERGWKGRAAIGVPLWVVLGAGGLFIGELIELLQQKLGTSKPKPETTYTEIEAVKMLDDGADRDDDKL